MAHVFKNKTANPQFAEVFDVTPQDVLDNSKDLTLIDVREISEFSGELGHVPGSKLVVLSTIPEKLKTIPTDNKTVVFICRSGGRSSQAAAFAKANGLTDVFNMQGGMLLWNHLQLPTEK